MQRFWANVDRSGGTDACWLWTGGTDTNGYGQLSVGGRLRLAHRMSWELTYGPIPPGRHYGTTCVCHKCDTPACVNPAHLFLGSHTDNMRDCAAKGRQPGAPGERHPHHKLTEAQVLNIRRLRKEGRTGPSIAQAYNISTTLVYRIAKGKTWKHLPI